MIYDKWKNTFSTFLDYAELLFTGPLKRCFLYPIFVQVFSVLILWVLKSRYDKISCAEHKSTKNSMTIKIYFYTFVISLATVIWIENGSYQNNEVISLEKKSFIIILCCEGRWVEFVTFFQHNLFNIYLKSKKYVIFSIK